MRRFAGIALVASLSIVALGACGGSGSHESSPDVPRRAGQFRLVEWGIGADVRTLSSGRRTISAVNLGHEVHELVVVRATSARDLPAQPDGSVDEAALGDTLVGEIADVPPGATRRKVFDLPAGDYVAICNIVDRMGGGMGDHGDGMPMRNEARGGHVHFALGMYTEFRVR
jgi:hypothetical protein